MQTTIELLSVPNVKSTPATPHSALGVESPLHAALLRLGTVGFSSPWPWRHGALINFKVNFALGSAFCSRNLLPISQGPALGFSSAGTGPRIHMLSTSGCLGSQGPLPPPAARFAVSYFWRQPLPWGSRKAHLEKAEGEFQRGSLRLELESQLLP